MTGGSGARALLRRRGRRIRDSLPPPEGVFLLTAMLSGLFGCGDDPPGDPGGAERGTPVAVWVVDAQDATEERYWAGSLEPLRIHPVHAPGEARVVEVAVQDGDEVAPGALLVRLEGLDQEARRGILRERQERLEEELARWRELAANGAAGPGEVLAAELRVFEAREALAGMEAIREGFSLRAGVAGQVVGLASAVGMQASAGQPLLSVEEADSYGVRLRIPAAESRWFDDVGRLEIEGSGGHPLPVARVVMGPDMQSGYVQVDVYPGEPADHVADEAAGDQAAPRALRREGAVVRYSARTEALIVPWTAVATDGGRTWVAVAVPDVDGAGQVEGSPPGEPRFRVERREVELGGAREGGIEVTRGVEAGDRVLQFEPRSHPEGRLVEPRSLARDGVPR